MKSKLKSAYSYIHENGISEFVMRKILDRAVDSYWKNKIFLSPRNLYVPLNKIKIDRPIFLLGTQGCGGTVLSRLIRLHPDVVYITGNSRFWGGHAELHDDARFKYMPDDWVLRSPGYHNMLWYEKYHPIFGFNRSWVYATDELLHEYRKTEKDFSANCEKSIVSVIKKCIRAYSKDLGSSRFHDMSQSYCVKVPLLRKVFPDVKFIVLLRNPFAMCWREITRKTGKYKDYAIVPSQTRKLELACQHWRNTYTIALNDLGNMANNIIIRYEDFTNNPIDNVNKLLDHCELDKKRYSFPDEKMKIPLGTKDRWKWWPLIPDVNDKYLDELPEWAREIIENHCGDLIRRFNYELDIIAK